VELLQKQREISQQSQAVAKELETREKSIKKIEDIQSRLRENIKSLEKVNSEKLIARYMNEFETHEDQLQGIWKDIEELSAQKASLVETASKSKKEIKNYGEALIAKLKLVRIGDIKN